MCVLENLEKLYNFRNKKPAQRVSNVPRASADAKRGGTKFLAILLPVILAYAATTSADEKIYWTEPDTQEILRADLDGSNREVLVNNIDDVSGIAVDPVGAKMYWLDRLFDSVERADLSGANIENLVNGTEGWDVEVDVEGGKVYWTAPDQRRIRRADLDGLNNETLIFHVDGLIFPVGIALDLKNGKMYLSDTGTDKIQRADLNGSNLEDLVTNVDAWDVELDLTEGKIYWADSVGAKIQRANLDGSDVVDVITDVEGLVNPVRIAVDPGEGKLYWIDSGTVKIQRADLDGSNIEDVVTSAQGLNNPMGISLELAFSVDFSMETNGNGTRTSPFNNLTVVVETATPNRRILIEPGTSSETFFGVGAITKTLVLHNNNPAGGSVVIGKETSRIPESGGFISVGAKRK